MIPLFPNGKMYSVLLGSFKVYVIEVYEYLTY